MGKTHIPTDHQVTFIHAMLIFFQNKADWDSKETQTQEGKGATRTYAEGRVLNLSEFGIFFNSVIFQASGLDSSILGSLGLYPLKL